MPNTQHPSGFTLIELIVVLGIIAVLAVTGVAVYSGQQSKARDVRREADIQAIAQALEANKTLNISTYNPILPSSFASGSIPEDTSVAQYSILYRTDSIIPASPTVWSTSSTNPTPVEGTGTTVATVNHTSINIPPNTTISWRVCALLENGPPTTTFCLANAQ